MADNKCSFCKDDLVASMTTNHMHLIEKIDNLGDKIETRLDRIENIQVEQASDIKHHIARTDALEEMLKPMYMERLQRQGVIKVITIMGKVVSVLLGGGIILELVKRFVF